MFQTPEVVKYPQNMFHVTPSTTFADRLAYARFLMHMRTGEAPSNAAVARAVGRANAWVTEIARRREAPTDYRVHRPMAEFLGVPEAWLVRAEGSVPEPELWKRWQAARAASSEGTQAAPPSGAKPGAVGTPVSSASLAAKKRAGAKKSS